MKRNDLKPGTVFQYIAKSTIRYVPPFNKENLPAIYRHVAASRIPNSLREVVVLWEPDRTAPTNQWGEVCP